MVAVGTMKLRLGADGQRDADGVAAAQHHRRTGLGDAGDELRQRKPRLHIPAHGVEQDQQALDGGVLLHGHQLGDDVLIFCRLLRIRRKGVPLDRADDRQAVDGVAALRRRHNAIVGDQIVLQTLQRGVSVGFSLGRALAFGFFAFASIPALLITKVAAQTKSAQRHCKICAASGDGPMVSVDVVKKFQVIFVQPSNIWKISQKLRQKIDNWCGTFYNSYKRVLQM